MTTEQAAELIDTLKKIQRSLEVLANHVAEVGFK